MRRLFLWIVLGTLFGPGAAAEPTKVLVREAVTLPAFFPAAGDHLFGVTCAPVRLTTRPATPAGPPFIADPGPTAQPVAVVCANKPNDFLESQGFQVTVHFDSLKELGEWRVDCQALFIAHNDFKSQTCG